MDSPGLPLVVKSNPARKVIFIGVIILVVVVVGELIWVLSGRIGIPFISSPYLLELTQPVYTFSGRVDKVSGNSLTVSSQVAEIGSSNAKPGQSQKMKKISYNVSVDSKTMISRSENQIPYIFKNTSVGPAVITSDKSSLSLKDVRAGDHVNITSSTDLRIAGNGFTASQITIQPLSTSINGSITAVNGNELIVRAVAPSESLVTANGPAVNQQPAVEKDYQVSVDNETEISRSGSPRLNISYLKQGMQVIVYTSEDTANITQVKALRIEPILAINPTVGQTASGSGAAADSNRFGPAVIVGNTAPTATPSTAKSAATQPPSTGTTNQSGPPVITSP